MMFSIMARKGTLTLLRYLWMRRLQEVADQRPTKRDRREILDVLRTRVSTAEECPFVGPVGTLEKSVFSSFVLLWAVPTAQIRQLPYSV